MEPRPHERGNPDERVVDEGLPVASMEPRPHERGNFRDQVQVLDVGRASMEPRPHERGNEKTKALKPPQLLKLQWSHVLTNVETRRLPARLRRHHNGFNGATSSRTWKPFFDFAGQPGRHLLQWSHVLTNVETKPLRPSPRRHTGAASMEPRPHERGNERRGLRETPLECASMEPRPHERGNLKPRRLLLLLILKASMEPRPHERGNACSRR